MAAEEETKYGEALLDYNMLEVSQKKIKCPIFSAREKFVQELNHAIWREDLSPGEILNKARSLQSELDILSNCPKYNQEELGCRICKTISDLRKTRADYLLELQLKIYSEPNIKDYAPL